MIEVPSQSHKNNHIDGCVCVSITQPGKICVRYRFRLDKCAPDRDQASGHRYFLRSKIQGLRERGQESKGGVPGNARSCMQCEGKWCRHNWVAREETCGLDILGEMW